jgi:hypothetical protein
MPLTIVEYGYNLGDKVAGADTIVANSPPILDWIQTRKASISEARSREHDQSRRNAILAESLFLLELTESLIIIASNYADQLNTMKLNMKAGDDVDSGQVNKTASIHTEMAYGFDNSYH